MSIRVLKAIIHDKGELTSQGFLKVPAYLTRTGVFTYRTKDGKVIKELRHPDDVFNPDSIESLKMAPLTDDHPTEMVTAENIKKYQVGWIGENVNADNDKLAAMAIVADREAQRKVDLGKKELSCGYTADLVAEEGIYNGEQYDVRQTNIKYNHVALVDEGRAGPMVRLRMDSADDAIEINSINDNPKENEMKKIVIDGKEVEVSQEVYDSIMSERKKSDEEKKKLEEEKQKSDEAAEQAKKEKDEMEAEKKKSDEEKEKEAAKKDSLQARVDSLEEKVSKTDNADVINKAVETRRSIEKVAESVGIVDTNGKSNSDVMKEVILKESPKADLKDKSDAYVQARFDGIAEDIAGREDRRHQFDGKFIKNDSREDKDFDSNAAREKAHADSKDLWKQPLAASKK